MPKTILQLLLLLFLILASIAPGAGAMRPLYPTAGLRFVDHNGAPLSGQTVRIQCYQQAASHDPFADVQLQTDASGNPASPLPPGCAYLAVLHLLFSQPSSKPGHPPAYQVYAASWQPGTSAPVLAAGDVTLDPANTLVLFNLVASLEWGEETGSLVLPQLLQGLRQASAYLYDLTDGRMAFGQVSISSGGKNWDAADLRLLAANDYRPSAFVGGIVPGSTASTAPASGVLSIYTPAEIFLGRFWDGLDAFDPLLGSWAQPAAYRTLVHEWAHYALFLYDEYQTTTGARTYCTCADLPQVGASSNPLVCSGATLDTAASAMAYQYTASELWLLPAPPLAPTACLGTDQMVVQGETDWSTLARWPAIQGLSFPWFSAPPPFDPGPALGLAGGFFASQPGVRSYFPFIAQASPPSASRLQLNLQLASKAPDAAALAALIPQVYLLQDLPAAPARLLAQGTTTGARPDLVTLGALSLLGVEPGGRLRISADRYVPAGAAYNGGRYIYPAPSAVEPPLTDGQTLALVEDTWLGSLDLTYAIQNRTLTGLTVNLTSPGAPPPVAPLAQLCSPAAETGCSANPAWKVQMAPAGPNHWQAVFSAPPGGELPAHGYIQVSAGPLGELERWYQVAGGTGPAHVDGHTGLADGLANVRSLNFNAASGDVAFMPAASAAALLAPLPAGIHGLAGLPLDFDLTNADAHHLGVPLIFTLAYSPQVLARQGIAAGSLRLLHFSYLSGAWQDVTGPGDPARSPDLHWISSLPVVEDGIFAVGW